MSFAQILLIYLKLVQSSRLCQVTEIKVRKKINLKVKISWDKTDYSPYFLCENIDIIWIYVYEILYVYIVSLEYKMFGGQRMLYSFKWTTKQSF